MLLAALAWSGTSRATCFDRVQDGPESDVDCGGDCIPCERGDMCHVPRDCYSGRCAEGACEEREYGKGAPIPNGYRVDQSDADSAAVARTIGWVSLAVGYGAAYVGALALPGKVTALYVPVVGPWIEVGDRGQELRGLIALDALLQTVGAGLIIGGIAAGGKQLIRTDGLTARFFLVPAPLGRDGGYSLFLRSTF